MSAFHAFPDRRRVLRGAGAALVLPWLESLAHARGPRRAAEPPLRFLFVMTPNGAQMDRWRPAAEGALAELPPTLEPLAPFREQLLVLGGLTHDKARPNGDGPGDHARAAAAFLTASQPRKTADSDLRVGVSIDQVLAAELGTRTRLRSLELGTEAGRMGGQCDSGYACAYSSNISWVGPGTPASKECDPRLVFERLFGDGPRGESAAARAERLARRRSVLDSVGADARALEPRLAVADRRRLDEYLSGIRELERRLELAERGRTRAPESVAAPEGIPSGFAEHVRLLADLLALAFATDSTRIASLMLANESSNRPYPGLGAPEGHHELSHHGDDPEKRAKVAAIDRHHVELFAHLVGRLAAQPEGDGSVLDRSLVLYGSAIADGNSHDHGDLPLVLVGRGGGVRSGRYLRFPPETPCANLFVSLLELAGVPRAGFGDSTGALAGLTG
jgi:uncharacterized protein DUF1552